MCPDRNRLELIFDSQFRALEKSKKITLRGIFFSRLFLLKLISVIGAPYDLEPETMKTSFFFFFFFKSSVTFDLFLFFNMKPCVILWCIQVVVICGELGFSSSYLVGIQIAKFYY